MKVKGPGSPFEIFFEKEELHNGEVIGLPAELKAIYRGDWLIPVDRQYRYSNFVVSHDGRASFSIPGHEGGGDISGFNRHDQWIMALCRSRADAVVVGANTLRSEPEHKWTTEFIFPDESEAFSELRAQEGRRPFPFQVFVTNSGKINSQAAVFNDSSLTSIIAAPSTSIDSIREMKLGNAQVLEIGVSEVNVRELYLRLEKDFGIKTVLCEGGPRFYGAMISQRLIDEEFLSISPVMVGSTHDQYRPGLIDGIALSPNNDLSGSLASVRRAGDLLFLRSHFRR